MKYFNTIRPTHEGSSAGGFAESIIGTNYLHRRNSNSREQSEETKKYYQSLTTGMAGEGKKLRGRKIYLNERSTVNWNNDDFRHPDAEKLDILRKNCETVLKQFEIFLNEKGIKELYTNLKTDFEINNFKKEIIQACL